MERRFFTSESVTEGHPDKICDQISDAILDELLRQDPNSRVACETTCTTGLVMVMGEITTNAYVDIQKIVRDTVREMMTDRVLNLMEYKGQYEEGAITTKKYKTILDSDPLGEVAPILTPIKKGYY